MTTTIKNLPTHDPSHRAGRPPLALVTGGSAGLGRALVDALADRGWTVVTDARHAPALDDVRRAGVVTLVGDVTDEAHRGRLLLAVDDAGTDGRLDLLVHNASTIGPSPMRPLGETDAAEAGEVWRTNVEAPLALTRDLLPRLVAARGALVSISSDAAVGHYETWGLYGASKAGLDHLTLTVGAEHPELAAYAVDPGDMRTAMHQAAFPGEDISDRPLPETVVPRLLALLETRPPSGRYRAADVAAEVAPSATPASELTGVAR